MKDREVRKSLGNDVKASLLLSTARLLDGFFDVDCQSIPAVPFRRRTSCTLEMETKWRGRGGREERQGGRRRKGEEKWA
jgi:hypothetical protein